MKTINDTFATIDSTLLTSVIGGCSSKKKKSKKPKQEQPEGPAPSDPSAEAGAPAVNAQLAQTAAPVCAPCSCGGATSIMINARY